MPEVIVRYKNKKSLQALEDMSKYLEFTILPSSSKKAASKASKKMPLLKQIEQGLKEVKLIREGKLKPVTLEELLND
ncbi:MAG: hypothetical protein H7178_07735 [Chitinophagaceae bacterium]|nr:hypothetical protein [Chitinophagaceae bacterium]